MPPQLRPQPADPDVWVGLDEPMPAEFADAWYWPRWREFVAQRRLQAAAQAWCAERGLDWRQESRRWRGWWADGIA